MGSDKVKIDWTNPNTGEKYVHVEKSDGERHLFYGPKDQGGEKQHGHAVFDSNGQVVFNRQPKGE
jgi:hypothetical protein